MRTIGVEFRRVLVDVGRDQMIGNDVAQQIQPEEGERGEDAAFVGNRRGEHVVEGGKPVCGDDDQEITGGVHVAHLASRMPLDAGQAGFKDWFQSLLVARCGGSFIWPIGMAPALFFILEDCSYPF